MNSFTVYRYKKRIEISENTITFHLRVCRLTKRLEDLTEIKKTITYGGLLHHLFGVRVSEGPKFCNMGYKEILLKFKFKEKEFCFVEFSIGDDIMVEGSMEKIDKINNLCSSVNTNIKLTSYDEYNFF